MKKRLLVLTLLLLCLAALPLLAELFGVSIDTLFGLAAPAPSAEETPVEPAPAPERPQAELPWPDDDGFYAVLYRGHTLLGSHAEDRRALQAQQSFRFQYAGPAQNVNSVFDLEIEGEVHGSACAGGDLSCGNVGGGVEADGDVNCESVGGAVNAGGDVSCDSVGGAVNASGDVSCDDVDGYVSAGGDVNCDKVNGRAVVHLICELILADRSLWAYRVVTVAAVGAVALRIVSEQLLFHLLDPAAGEVMGDEGDRHDDEDVEERRVFQRFDEVCHRKGSFPVVYCTHKRRIAQSEEHLQ